MQASENADAQLENLKPLPQPGSPEYQALGTPKFGRQSPEQVISTTVETVELSGESSAISDDEARQQIASRRSHQNAQERAGVKFPINRLAKFAKQDGKYASRVGQGAPVFMAGVLEYLTMELLDLASRIAVDDKSAAKTKDGGKIIGPRHLMLAVRKDAEFSKFFKKADFHEAGRLPVGVAAAKTAKKKKAAEESSDEEAMDEGE